VVVSSGPADLLVVRQHALAEEAGRCQVEGGVLHVREGAERYGVGVEGVGGRDIERAGEAMSLSSLWSCRRTATVSPSVTGRDLSAARATLIEGVNSTRDW
jgi:hypothetical protein